MDFLSALMWVQQHSILAMLAVFALIVATTYWPGRKDSIERNGDIPLRDDEPAHVRQPLRGNR